MVEFTDELLIPSNLYYRLLAPICQKITLQHPHYNVALHSAAYRWNIKCQKCAGMGINGFTFKKINENENIIEKKILGTSKS